MSRMSMRLKDPDEIALPVKPIYKGLPQKPVYFDKKAEGGIVAPFQRLPKSFRKFLDAHGDEYIDTFELYRAPLDKLTNTVLQLLTAGDWENIKKRAGADALFHTYAIINGKYLYEKTAVPSLKEGSTSAVSKEGAEKTRAPIRRTTIHDFVGRAINKMGDAYFTYNAFSNNCQDFLMASLEANGMSTMLTKNFLKQDTKKLVEETPSLSRYLAEGITNLANKATNLYEEITQKKGGIRRRHRIDYTHHSMKKKFGV